MSKEIAERLYSQVTARAGLLALVSQVTGLPSATVNFYPGDDGGELAIHVHDNPAGFEWWREALGLDPTDAKSHVLTDFCTVTVTGAVGAVAVTVTGYLPLPADAPVLSAA
jgi:hypothetical protein